MESRRNICRHRAHPRGRCIGCQDSRRPARSQISHHQRGQHSQLRQLVAGTSPEPEHPIIQLHLRYVSIGHTDNGHQ
eukprot:14158757-Heterocapsa_arctica.AAC.1